MRLFQIRGDVECPYSLDNEQFAANFSKILQRKNLQDKTTTLHKNNLNQKQEVPEGGHGASEFENLNEQEFVDSDEKQKDKIFFKNQFLLYKTKIILDSEYIQE